MPRSRSTVVMVTCCPRATNPGEKARALNIKSASVRRGFRLSRESRESSACRTMVESQILSCATEKANLRPVAFLIFFPRATRAGIVAPNFWLVAYDRLHLAGFFARRCRTLIGPGKGQRTARTSSLTQRFRRLLLDYLQIEERTDRSGVNPIEHRLEQIKTLFLVFDQRILLPVSVQDNSLLNMIERQQLKFSQITEAVKHVFA